MERNVCGSLYNNSDMTSSSSRYEADAISLKFWMKLVVVTTVVLGALGFVTNALTLCALCRVKGKLTPHLLFIVNLSSADLMFSVVHPLRIITIFALLSGETLPEWFRQDYGQIGIHVFVGDIGFFVLVFTLGCISYDHYIAILQPLLYKKMMTRSRAIALICGTWIIGIVSSGSQYIVTGVYHVFNWNQTFYDSFVQVPYSNLYLVITMVYLTVVMATYSYVMVFVEVRKVALRRTSITYVTGVTTGVTLRKRRRSMITSLLIIGTFIAFWMPGNILATITLVLPPTDAKLDIPAVFLFILPCLNSICDPLIYTLRLSIVRSGFSKSRKDIAECSNV